MTPCPRCNRIGFEIVQVPTSLYRCGFYTVSMVCRNCRGRRYIVQTLDFKSAAAGESV